MARDRVSIDQFPGAVMAQLEEYVSMASDEVKEAVRTVSEDVKSEIQSRYPSADNFAADGVAYFKQDVLHIEDYTDKKDPALEEQIEAVLDESGIFYGKGETWIDSEKLYEVLYEMEVSA